MSEHSENPDKPTAAFESGYNTANSQHIDTVEEDKGIPETLISFIVGVIFGVVIPLLLKFFFSNVVELMSPSAPLPTLGEDGGDYSGLVDLNSQVSLVDQLTETFASYATVLWLLALLYLFPIVYQLRTAVIFGKIANTCCLALTLLGPPLVLLILPLWGEVLT